MSEIYRMTKEQSIENMVLDPGVRRIARRNAIDMILESYEKLGIPEEDREAAKERLIHGVKSKDEEGNIIRIPWSRKQIAATLNTANELLKMSDPNHVVDKREIVIFDGKDEGPSTSTVE